MSSVTVEDVTDSVPSQVDVATLKTEALAMLNNNSLYKDSKVVTEWSSGVDKLLTKDNFLAAYVDNKSFIEFAVDTMDTVLFEKLAVTFMQETVKRYNNQFYITTSLLESSRKKQESGPDSIRRVFQLWF